MNKDTLHIKFEQITDFIVGEIAIEEKNEISDHLNNCQTCHQEFTNVQNVIGIMKNDVLEEVPSHILERTFDLIKFTKPEINKPNLIKRLIATLQNESSSLVPALGLRSTEPENTKRFWLTTEDAEIDLRYEKDGDFRKVSGQIFGDFGSGKVVLQSSENYFTAELNKLSEFSLSEVPKGVYRIIFYFEQVEIEFPTFVIE